MRHPILLLSLLVLLVPQLHAADLTKIDRSIRKEPVYQSKTPRYCLLVFGPEAKTRVWLVLDGKNLYVDRNGNGDLTEEGEKIAAQKGLEVLQEDVFEIDEIHDGERSHKNLTLHVRKVDYLATNYPEMKEKIARLPDGRGYHLTIDVELPGWKGRGAGGRIRQLASFLDKRGLLTFSAQPHDAPIIHLGGPWQILYRRQLNRLMVGHEDELCFSIGTPGLGEGTTAYLFYEVTVPENLAPRVEITYSPVKPGEPPHKRLYELKERC